MRLVNILIAICVVLSATAMDSMVLDRGLTTRLMVWSLCLVVLCLCFKRFPIPRNMIVVCFCGYALCAGMSLWNAMSPMEGVFEFARIILMLLSICLFSCVIKRKFLFITLALLGLGLASYGIYEYMSTNRTGFWGMECIGLMGCRNPWSQAQVLLLPFCVCTFVYWRGLSVISSGAILFNLLFLFNRASILALGIGCVAVALMNRRWRYYILIGAILVIPACVLYATINVDSLIPRLEFWGASLKLAKEFPVLGVGIGNWVFEIPRYAATINVPGIYTKVIYQRPHNDFIWVLCETGVPGLICYLGIFGFGLYYAIKTRNLIVLCGLTMYIVIAFFSFPKDRPFLCMMLVLYLSVLMMNSPVLKSAYISWVTVVLIACVSSEFVLYHLTERHLAKVSYYTSREQWSKVIEETDKCSFVNPLALSGVPVKWFRGNAYLHLGDVNQAARDSLAALNQNPNNIYVLDRMGCFWREAGEYEKAEECFTRALGIVPDFEHSKTNLEKLKG